MPAAASHFVWYEFRTTDADAALAFYGHVVGWEGRHGDVEGKRYTQLLAGDAAIAGLMTLPEEARAAGARTGWVGYLGVDNVDAMAARLLAAGGRLYHPPMDIPGIGRFVSAADPQEAHLALFQPLPGTQRDTPPPGTPGTVGWHELHAADRDSALALYAGLFGWQKGEAIDMGSMGIYQLLTTGAVPFGGMMTRMDPARRPAWLYYFTVAGIDAAAARVLAAGGQVLQGPHEVPGGSWIVQAQDPQGGHFALVAPPS